mmetsp:Transcript_12030/g.34631  ORF Transcript_12030/g.34631 Transcript_12030/m.34631 type:complete len:84 (+) Transcript_12030:583-834(+)
MKNIFDVSLPATKPTKIVRNEMELFTTAFHDHYTCSGQVLALVGRQAEAWRTAHLAIWRLAHSWCYDWVVIRAETHRSHMSSY